MNSNLAEELGLIAIVAFTFFILGFAASDEIRNGELQRRGLKEYDKRTGRLIWTEKAGGEKGGDK